jgi:Tol biopolymer transport system component
MYIVDLQTPATSLVRQWTNKGSLYWIYAWSPDGNTLSYLSSDGDKVAWHLRSSAGRRDFEPVGIDPRPGRQP